MFLVCEPSLDLDVFQKCGEILITPSEPGSTFMASVAFFFFVVLVVTGHMTSLESGQDLEQAAGWYHQPAG